MSSSAASGFAGAVGVSPVRAASLLLPVAVMLSLASCSGGRAVRVRPSMPNVGALEEQTYARVNRYRVSKGLRALAWSDVAAGEARLHSERMALGKTRLGHSGFDKRVAIIGRTHPWRKAGENVAVNRSSASVVERWLKKRGHRKNIEGDFDATGVGAAATQDGAVYFTQIFVKSK
jgi:uncharacterized protein YkwD